MIGVFVVSSESESGSGDVTHTASCPPGTVLLGGGGLLSDPSNDEMATSFPSATGEGGTWTASGDRKAGFSTLTVYAVCAEPAS